MVDTKDMSALPPKRRFVSSFSVSGRLASLRHAERGVKIVLRTQPNFWIHLAASGLVAMAAALLHVQRWEWCGLIAAMASVWVAETVNTAIEFACHAPNGSSHTHLHVARDVAAAAVLMASLGAAAIGVVVLIPHLFNRGL